MIRTKSRGDKTLFLPDKAEHVEQEIPKTTVIVVLHIIQGCFETLIVISLSQPISKYHGDPLAGIGVL